MSTAGQGAVALMTPVLIGKPVGFVCLLVFIVLEEYAMRKKINKKGQDFGVEAKLVSGTILVINAYFVVGPSCFWI